MSTQQSGLASGNKQNIAGGATPRSRSRFQLTYSKFQTERFAEYVPFFVMEGVKNDSLPLHSNHEVQTYTLKSPILQSLAKKKDYFAVPMQSILPINWEKFYTEPSIGQDVPTDSGLGVENFWNKYRTLFINSFNTVDTTLSGTGTVASKVDQLLHFLLFFEPIYSCGSLMETLGISGHNWCRIFDKRTTAPKFITYDEFFDYLVGFISNFLSSAIGNSVSFTIGSQTYVIRDDADRVIPGTTQSITLRQALELMRDDLTFSVTAVNGTGLIPSGFDLSDEFDLQYMPSSDAPLNLGRLWAYALVCAHFYSNDHVDFIFSAELFRSYILQVCTCSNSSAGNILPGYFYVNGLQYQYDALSAFFFNRFIDKFNTSGIFGQKTGSNYGSTGPESLNEAYAYHTALFSFKRSLRFMDYFTGSRAYPLAGNQNPAAPVSGGAVDVLEMSKASMMTKFLQAVNRSGRKFSNYMKELFGGKDLAYDFHNPMYLAHTSDLVGAQETDNTGAAQVSNEIAVTSRLRATSSRNAFSFTPDRDCIVIGISYYDLPRVYLRATEKQNFFLDRFDMFNPFMQYIGDQGISEAEIGTESPNVGQNFSYTNRHMEYKQRFNQGCGGFCVPSTGLDNWIFPADLLGRKYFHNISPTFIRSFNSELDRFYQRLTGFSLGTYFHFIVRYDNQMDASREMTYAPTINV